MPTLFTSIETDLTSFLDSLNPEDVMSMVDSATFLKGNQYYEWDLVSEAQYSFDKNSLSALVSGSLDYNVLLALNAGNLNANCSCPVAGMCKHITAVLIYASRHGEEIEIGVNRKEDSPQYKQLLACSKEELVSLVLKWAPEEFFLQMHNRHASKAEAQETYSRVEDAIHRIFSNTELLYSPEEFNEALEKQIFRLTGLEQQLQEELGELIFLVMREVEKAFDSGYLYADEFSTNFELPDSFNTLVIQYVKALPYTAKTFFLERLDAALQESAYDTFDSLAGLSQESFKEAELPALKQMVLMEYQDLSTSLLEEYYELLRPLLTETEKQAMLLHLKETSDSWLLELAELYRKQGKDKEAMEMIGNSLSGQDEGYEEEPLYLLYLDLLSSHGLAKQEVCMDVVEHCASSSILAKISEVYGEDTAAFEQVVEQKNPQELLDYLEKQGRLTEALSLLKRNDAIWTHYRWVFFKKHKHKFPEEALAYFGEVIDKNLQYTGNSHYHTISEALRQIQEVNESKAAAMAAEIRFKYNSRNSLLNLLKEI